jgi:hypothetical protein
MVVVSVAIWSAMGAVCLRLLSNGGRLRPITAFVVVLTGLGWLTIAVSLTFGPFLASFASDSAPMLSPSRSAGRTGHSSTDQLSSRPAGFATGASGRS